MNNVLPTLPSLPIPRAIRWESPSIDMVEIRRWWRARMESELDERFLPPTGIIVPHVAAVFVYRTGTALGFVENFITNPLATERGTAIESIVMALHKYCYSLGIERVICTPVHETVAGIVSACPHYKFVIGHGPQIAIEVNPQFGELDETP